MGIGLPQWLEGTALITLGVVVVYNLTVDISHYYLDRKRRDELRRQSGRLLPNEEGYEL